MAKLNVNQGIRAKEVRVIDAEGTQLGVMLTREAIKKAEETGLDLVEVAPTSNPPVCRIMDYGKYKYEQSKKQHSAKLHSKTAQLKEIKLRPYTDIHDLEVKIRHSAEFLAEGHKVKVSLMFRGRENVNQSIGRALMNRFMEKISVHGTIEQLPKMEGNTLVMIVVPKSDKGPKSQKPPAVKPTGPPKEIKQE
ncbi:MAG: translation initiation factor IF-3 [Nitrospirae bacterium]|nr:translation initiation factor IF-3 [Nitrospirota bacterium]MBI3353114.1 translation initiation factor IF-3 [Nitrospirota bacterium]